MARINIKFTGYDEYRRSGKKPKRSDEGSPWQKVQMVSEIPADRPTDAKYKPRYVRT